MTQITFKNNPIKLSGSEVNEGDIAPNFTVLDNSLNQITLDDYKNKKKLISVIPSIDTGVCDSHLSFGRNYGLVMDELRLLARSVFVLNENNKVVYKEIVSEGTNYPDFEAALKAYRNI